jgi:subtilisin family serine protease
MLVLGTILWRKSTPLFFNTNLANNNYLSKKNSKEVVTIYKLSPYQVMSQTKQLPPKYINQAKAILKRLDVYEEWKKTQGEGSKVGIIDTGIDTDHQDLKLNIKGVYNSFDGSQKIEDKEGHGTHCAGIIGANGILTGVAPKTDLYIVKALNDKGEGTEDSLIRGIEWCIEQNVDVISMSLGAQSGSKRLQAALRRAVEKDIIPICAAGNDAKGNKTKISIDYPAKYPETIAVGAIDLKSQIANFSSIGNVDVVSFGVNIISTFKDNSYAVLSGTSMATPYIAGSATLSQANARLKIGRRLTLEEMKLIFSLESKDLGTIGKDQIYGFGEFTF